MNPRLVRIVGAAVAGLITLVLVYQATQVRASNDESVTVLVAGRELAPRSTVTADLVRTQAMPRHTVPAGALSSFEEIGGRVIRDAVFPGEVIIAGRLAPPGGDRSASALVPPDKPYAFNLPAALFISAPPRLQLHDRIDIVGYPRGRPLSEGGVLVSNLEIIDLSPRVSDNASESSVLTVAASAEDIVRLLASREGYSLGIAVRPFVRR